jgi:hypothetical protein
VYFLLDKGARERYTGSIIIDAAPEGDEKKALFLTHFGGSERR